MLIDSFRRLKEAIASNPDNRGSYSTIIRNLRHEYRIFGEAVSLGVLKVGGKYVNCTLDPSFEKELKRVLGV